MTRPIAQKYCEGKVKSTLKRGSKELEIVKREGYNVIDCYKEFTIKRNCVFIYEKGKGKSLLSIL